MTNFCLSASLINMLLFMQWESMSRYSSWCFLLQYNTEQEIAKGYLSVPREASMRAACHLWQQERSLRLQGNPSEASLEGSLGTGTPHHLCPALPIISHLGLQGYCEIFPLDIREWSQLFIKDPGRLQPWKFYLSGYGPNRTNWGILLNPLHSYKPHTT